MGRRHLMHLVVCYDVVDNNRRNRLFRRLKGFLRPVQKSVFEGKLSGARFGALIEAITQTVDLQTDTVRLYQLPPGCIPLIELIGIASPVRSPDEDEVI